MNINQLRYLKIVLAIPCLLSLQTTIGQKSISQSFAGVIPLDPALRYGKLANGFTYYIRHTGVEKNKARLELLVKAGNEQQDADQLELAHLLEHMAFKPTKHFTDGVFAYADTQGLKIGGDINAGTGASSTNYFINVYLDKPGLLEQGFHWLREVAQDGILFEPKKIDGERGVVLGEIRGNSSIMSREWPYIKKVMGSSKYTDRVYADTRDNVKNFKPETLIRFYKDWYRPDLQALVVVGDINVDEIEQQIKEQFGNLKMNANPRQLDAPLPVVLNGENQFISINNPKDKDTELKIIIKQPQSQLRTETDFRKEIIYSVCKNMLQARINEWNEKENALESVSFDYRRRYGNTGNPFDAFLTEVRLKEGTFTASFYPFIKEMERVKRYGFTSKELQKAKETFLNERPLNGLMEIEQDYVQHFFKGYAAPGETYKKEMRTRLCREISLAEVNTEVNKWMATNNRDIVILAPEKSILPDEAMVDKWFAEARKEKLDAYVYQDEEKVLSQPLMSQQELNKLRNPNLKLLNQSVIPEIGVTQWILPNGVKVLLKPLTAVAAGNITISSVKQHITSYYPDSNYAQAYFALRMVRNSGLGAYDGKTLEKFCQKKGITISPSNASVKNINDLPIALQGIYLYFTQPNKSVSALEKIIADKKQEFLVKNERATPIDKFTEASWNLVEGDRKDLLTPDHLNKVDADKAFQFYKEYFSNATDFTFVITGNFDLNSIKPLVIKYLGSLPVKPSNNPKAIQKQMLPPSYEKKVKIFYAEGEEDKARVKLLFRGPYAYTWFNKAKTEILGEILNILIFHRIREVEGLDYTPSASGSISTYQGGAFDFCIAVSPTATNIDKAIACSMDELKQLKLNGPTLELIDKARSQLRSRLQDNLNSDSFWGIYISDQVKDGKDLKEILEYEKALNSCTPQDMQQMAQQFFKEENYQQYLLMPERFKKTLDEQVNSKKNKWFNLLPQEDSVFGTGSEKAYRELLLNKKPDTVIVAVLDNGIDTTHLNLLPVLWRQRNEQGNDEDRNGYKADFYGWNFLGSKTGKNLFNAGLEYQRLYFRFNDKGQDYKLVAGNKKRVWNSYEEINSRVKDDSIKRVERLAQYLNLICISDSIVQKVLGKTQYSYADIKDKKPGKEDQRNAFYYMQAQLGSDTSLTNTLKLKELFSTYEKQKQKALENFLNKRTALIGDNYQNIQDRYYGNNDVTAGMSCFHGTHVAGIIAGAGNKDQPMNAVKIMAIRVVPTEGDEYDKDVALGIRYAVDNGARVINMSFSKPYSPEQSWVEEAIQYAEKKNVLIVKAAGNDAQNIDSVAIYPTKNYRKANKEASNMIIVGASGQDSTRLIASFSNYGKKTVDVFAPGDEIYSTIPNNQYAALSGTSMAAPVVSGLAAILFSYYPQLSCRQVKYIIENTVTPIKFLVTQPGIKKKVLMNELCSSGGIVNAYQAVLMAESIQKNKLK